MSEYCHMKRAITLLFVTLAMLAGCASPAYYGQAIKGHLAIMSNRDDIQALLERGELDAELKAQLELATEIRAFASNRLGLPRNDSYSEFVRTGRTAVTWNVVATEEFSLQPERWCFLVAGCVPYRGYFSQNGAERFANSLRKRSLDVIVSPAIAYSTLGWFDDPLLDTMLQFREEQLAGFIFHELAHQQLYVKNDTLFNESYAGFIEEAGVAAWLRETGRVDSQVRWKAEAKARAGFEALLSTTRKRLQEEFDSGHSADIMRQNKSTIYAEMKVQYQRLIRDEWNGHRFYESWFNREMNNARLALANSYQGGLCAFENLYELAGRDIVQFQQSAAEKASLSRAQRAVWLSQPCDNFQAGH